MADSRNQSQKHFILVWVSRFFTHQSRQPWKDVFNLRAGSDPHKAHCCRWFIHCEYYTTQNEDFEEDGDGFSSLIQGCPYRGVPVKYYISSLFYYLSVTLCLIDFCPIFWLILLSQCWWRCLHHLCNCKSVHNPSLQFLKTLHCIVDLISKNHFLLHSINHNDKQWKQSLSSLIPRFLPQHFVEDLASWHILSGTDRMKWTAIFRFLHKSYIGFKSVFKFISKLFLWIFMLFLR